MGLIEDIKKDAFGNGTKIQSSDSTTLEKIFNNMFYLDKNIEEETKFVKQVMTRGLESQERVGLHASAMLKGDKELAEIFYSLGSNYAFLTNIIRKSIYEYYVGKRYILKNQRKTANVFEKRMQPRTDDCQLLQLDMIISSIEARWVE